MNEEQIIKLIHQHRQAIDENLLMSSELEQLQGSLEAFLDKKLTGTDILSLRYRKFMAPGAKARTLWSTENGYPIGGQAYIQPWIAFFEKYLAGKTIKERLETDNLFVEARTRGSDLTLLVGERSEGEKAHIVIDEDTGEIRVDPKDAPPSTVLKKIETVLTTWEGNRIQTTMDFLRNETQVVLGIQELPKEDGEPFNRTRPAVSDLNAFCAEFESLMKTYPPNGFHRVPPPEWKPLLARIETYLRASLGEDYVSRFYNIKLDQEKPDSIDLQSGRSSPQLAFFWEIVSRYDALRMIRDEIRSK